MSDNTHNKGQGGRRQVFGGRLFITAATGVLPQPMRLCQLSNPDLLLASSAPCSFILDSGVSWQQVTADPWCRPCGQPAQSGAASV